MIDQVTAWNIPFQGRVSVGEKVFYRFCNGRADEVWSIVHMFVLQGSG